MIDFSQTWFLLATLRTVAQKNTQKHLKEIEIFVDSSNINEGIKVVFIFKRKDSTRTKRI